ncbi:6-pyruvoyl tetrahydrobiopterin synthase [Sarcoptes scabiei]|uniref:6-pyruvoyltetrahydropterin synthase n=1 Tax=Sarcoptes scabiei TaxID=52283 RepID=A0A834R1Z8_SARSC|nr:6-pyruvoyl tetrahydrobiopterin synthase [Sarcoptes scabiei]UXI17170.1 Ubiquitin carboxyl-terminal hydrolase 14 [Sarcoptes scabiei]
MTDILATKSTSRPLVYLTRIEKFSSAHRLFQKNRLGSSSIETPDNSIYGKCNNIHGHNYTLEVMIKGPIDSETGMLINVADLKAIIDEHVMKHLDHKYIDEEVDYFCQSQQISTSENVCVYIWNQIGSHLPKSVRLHRIRLHETDKNIVDYYGEMFSNS